ADQGLCRWPLSWSKEQGKSCLRIGPPDWFNGFHQAGLFKSANHYRTTRLPGTNVIAVADYHNFRMVLVDADHPDRKVEALTYLPSRDRRITSVSASPDGRWLATGSWRDSGIQIWDLLSRKLVRTLRPPVAP